MFLFSLYLQVMMNVHETSCDNNFMVLGESNHYAVHLKLIQRAVCQLYINKTEIKKNPPKKEYAITQIKKETIYISICLYMHKILSEVYTQFIQHCLPPKRGNWMLKEHICVCVCVRVCTLRHIRRDFQCKPFCNFGVFEPCGWISYSKYK